jgi:hypothetical protein
MTKGFHEMQQTSISTVAYAASSGTVFLGLTVDQWGIAAAILGIVGVLATFGFNVWFKMKYGRKG